MAVGVLSGTGPDCYSIISKGDKIVVWDIVSELPDVSQVAQGQLYVYWSNLSECSYFVYLMADNRIVEPVQFPVLVYNTADSHLYYISTETIVDVYDHLENAPYFEERIALLEKQVKEILAGGGSTDVTTTPPPCEPEDPEPEEPTTTTTTTTPKPVDPTTTTTTTTPKPAPAMQISSFNMDVA